MSASDHDAPQVSWLLWVSTGAVFGRLSATGSMSRRDKVADLRPSTFGRGLLGEDESEDPTKNHYRATWSGLRQPYLQDKTEIALDPRWRRKAGRAPENRKQTRGNSMVNTQQSRAQKTPLAPCPKSRTGRASIESTREDTRET